MRSHPLFRSRVARAAAIAAGVAVAAVAGAMPWDTDMSDATSVKAYEAKMRAPAEGTVSQPNPMSPVMFAPNFTRGTPEGDALTNPLPADEATLAQGKKMFDVYCTPCHGDGVNLGTVAAPGRFPGIPQLGTPNGRLHLRTDGWVYLTIRNGGGLMPSYGWSMNDTEMWSVVAYARTLPDAQYVPPAPAPAAPAAGVQ